MNLLDPSTALITWFNQNKRDLPWRETKDPYRIWLSEIILQQTRVNQGLPYYLNFLKKYPNLESLACASEKEVLRLWQGLGYYSRARNLLTCARAIKTRYNGKFPSTSEVLLKLPGIGPYTAAAIASFAFNEPVAAIDGNGLRVFSRYFGIRDDIRANTTINTIRALANEMISKSFPDIFNQAVMEIGATLCLPAKPECMDCPLQNRCISFANDWQNEIPYKSKVKKPRNRYFNYIIFRDRQKISLNKRKAGDIWQGLFDFYLIEENKLLDPDEFEDPFVIELLQRGYSICKTGKDYKHILSHQRIYSRFYELTLNPDPTLKQISLLKRNALRFYSMEEIVNLPKPVLVDNFLKSYFKSY